MRSIILFILFLLSSKAVYGQFFCETPAVSSNMVYNEMLSAANSNSQPLDFKLRVYFHVINNGFNHNEVLYAFNLLNEAYNDHQIFFEWDCYIDHIQTDPIATSTIFNVNSHQDGIDIYLYRYGPNDPDGFGLANGVGESSEFLVAGRYKYLPFNILPLTQVISHEMGHVLFLWHTHHSDITEGNGCVELVNGSNCEICGDLVCDTPSDPGINHLVDSQCNWLGSGFDGNGHPFNPDTRNIMSYSSTDCLQSISSGQGQRARNAISLLQYLADCRVMENDIFINSDVVISGHKAFQNNIIVRNNSTFTILGSISMASDKRIIVEKGAKLVLDGGKITNYCNDTWEGIIVKGNYNLNQSNPANYGIVQTMNGAIIENARIGIGYADEGPHTDWGGLIQCDNTSFINCWKGAQFLKYNFENESYFNECHFENCNEGVTIWANKGIEFSENTFEVLKNGIASVDAKYQVTNHNLFDGGQYGILSQATAGNQASLNVKDDNTFMNLARGISVSGNSGYKVVSIENNNFIQNQWGLLVNGEEFYLSNSNNFDMHDNAIISASTGIDYNKIICNNLDEQGVGILTMWYNGKTTFLSNQFLNTLSTGADYAGFFSDIIDEVGNSNLAANNSFSNIQRDISSNMECDYFKYYKYPQDPGPDYPGNYSVFNTDIGANSTPCTQIPPANVTKPVVVSKIQNYCIKLALYRSNPNNPVYKNEFAVAHRSLHEYFYAWAAQMEQTGNYAEIEALLKTICNDRWKKKLFNLYFKLGNYAAAWQVLDEMEDPRLKIIPIVPEDLQDDSRASFVETQRLNVLLHQSNFNYSTSPSELNVLRTNAEEKIPESAFAKGLLYLLTGEIVEPVVPAQYNQPVVPRNIQSAQTEWVIFPNPAREEVRVRIGGNSDFSGTMTVFHINGNKVGEERITEAKGSDHGIDISTYANGVYYLIMRDEVNKPVFYGKFVKNNLK